jgi:hypothetical protein
VKTPIYTSMLFRETGQQPLLQSELSKSQDTATQQQHIVCLRIKLADPQGPTDVMTFSSSNNSDYNNNSLHLLAQHIRWMGQLPLLAVTC